MLRRKLFAYTCMLVIGISAGFIFAERGKIIFAAALLLGLSILICYIKIDTEHDTAAIKKILFAIMLGGFIIFIISYISFNAYLRDTNGEIIDVESVEEIEGIITAAEKNDDAYKLTVETEFPIKQKLLLNYYSDIEGNNTCRLIGRRLCAYGKLKEASKQRNPLCFDYSVYLKSKGICYTFTAKSIEIKKYDDSWVWKYRRLLLAKRILLEEEFNDSPKIKAFIKGTVFGDKSEIDDTVITEFNENSTGHILAVSGLHIGFLFALLKALSKRRKSLSVSLCIITIIFLYGEMTLWSASTIRAVIVMSVNLLASHFLRKADMLTSISAAAALILIVNPYQLFNSGFQMSFIAMLGICFITKPLSFFVGDSCAMILAVQLAVAPYTAYTFNRFNPLSVFINIPIVYLASIMVPCCLIQLGIISITGCSIDILNDVIKLVSKLILKVNSVLNMDGAFSDKVVSINLGVLISLYLILLFVCSEWFRVKLIRREGRIIGRVTALMLIPCIIIILGFNNIFLNDSIVFVDVGQGACVHVRVREGLFSEKNYIIDGGGSDNYNVGKNTLESYLLKNNVSHIDAAFVTHLHTDHYKGICELANEGIIDSLVVFEGNKLKSETISEETGISRDSIEYIKAGDILSLDSADDISESNAYIEALWPKKASNSEYLSMLEADDENSMSLVFKLTINGISVIITGDLDEDGEGELIKEYRDYLNADILSVGHHGSKYSCCEEFIEAVDPDCAVIQVGQNNYGHPTPETLERLSSACIDTYRNDKQGAIGINIKNGRINAIHTMLDFSDTLV